MIMRHWMDCPVTTYGRLREWRIFTRRQDHAPNADTGEVCHDFTCFGRAVVIPGIKTEPATYEDQVESMCVASGAGLLLVDGHEYPIRAGSTFNIPPGVPHHFGNPGDEELELIFGRRPPASTDGDFKLAHWTEDRPEGEWGSLFQGHWNHTYRGPSCDVHIADITPRKFSGPHDHTEILDEIWYVHRGNGWHWMGQDYRPQGPGHALWLDPTELHALMNPGETNVEYIYCASWPLVQDRERTRPQEESGPATTAEKIAALEDRFAALTKAYRKTRIGIWYVDQNIPRIERLIQSLKEGEGLD